MYDYKSLPTQNNELHLLTRFRRYRFGVVVDVKIVVDVKVGEDYGVYKNAVEHNSSLVKTCIDASGKDSSHLFSALNEAYVGFALAFKSSLIAGHNPRSNMKFVHANSTLQ